jgi:hypothetical protein
MPGVGGITLGQSASLIQPPYVAGRWYWSETQLITGAAALAANSIRLSCFRVKRPITISDLFVRISTLFAGGNIQLAIYATDSVTQMPTGTAICTTASITTASAAMVSATISGSGVLDPGLYWFAVNSYNSTAILNGYFNGCAQDSSLIGSATLASLSTATNAMSLSFTTPQTFGTWASLTSASFTEAPGTPGAAFGFKVSVGG